MNVSFIYELPEMAGGRGIVNGALGGWQVSGTVQARSGGALRITQASGIDRSRPDVVEGVDLILDDWQSTCNATGCNYLNTAGFRAVPVSTVTNATLRPGTYMLDMARGPASTNVNTTIAKSFGLGSGTRLQVRADIFNVLNHKNWGGPQTAITNVDFGRITSAGGSRTMQFGARLSF
jgi:hypothetical protein